MSFLTLYTLALVGTLLFNLVWAIYTTLSKEKIMIEQGEGSLPASTYGFIVVRHVARAIFYVIILSSLPEPFETFIIDPHTGKLWIVSLFLLISIVVELFSAVFETIIRFVFLNYTYRKMSKETTEK